MATIDLTSGAVNITTSETDNMEHGTQYAHYLRDDPNKPTPGYYSNLISLATNKIIIWDPYFHDVDTEIFKNLSHSVEVYVLSSKSNNNKNQYLSGLEMRTNEYINNNVRGTCLFNFGFVDTCIYGKELWNTHDRFLIVDGRYFLIGASVAHHLKAHDSTGICELVNENDKNIIQNAFNQCWGICTHDITYITVTI